MQKDLQRQMCRSSCEVEVNIELIYGDCLEEIKRLPDESIDFCLTDPPYKLTPGGRTGKNTPRGGVFGKNESGMKNGKIFKENVINFSEWLPEVHRVMKDKTHVAIFINNRNLFKLHEQAIKYFKFKNLLIWDKVHVNPSRSYMIRTEYILLLGKGFCRGVNDMGRHNIFTMSNRCKGKVHPTQKPVQLLKELIEQSSNKGDVVLDPFMGSGSAAIACCVAGRKFIGIEKDILYYDMATVRVKNMDDTLKKQEIAAQEIKQEHMTGLE